MASRGRIWAVAALLAVLVTSCGFAADTGAHPSPTSPVPADHATSSPTGSPTPGPTALIAMVSSDGGPLTAAETGAAVRRCLGKRASASDIAAARVDYARDIAYLTDDVLTLPTIILTVGRSRIVCNRDGRVPPRAAAGSQEPDAAHAAIVVASDGITGTFNGPFADGMSPFAPCVVLRVSAEVARVVMRLDWPTGDSVWYGAAIENGYAVVSAWMGGTIGSPVDIDLTTVRTQIRAFDATGRELSVS
jgi:hypothetical protein